LNQLSPEQLGILLQSTFTKELKFSEIGVARNPGLHAVQ